MLFGSLLSHYFNCGQSSPWAHYRLLLHLLLSFQFCCPRKNLCKFASTSSVLIASLVVSALLRRLWVNSHLPWVELGVGFPMSWFSFLLTHWTYEPKPIGSNPHRVGCWTAVGRRIFQSQIQSVLHSCTSHLTPSLTVCTLPPRNQQVHPLSCVQTHWFPVFARLWSTSVFLQSTPLSDYCVNSICCQLTLTRDQGCGRPDYRPR